MEGAGEGSPLLCCIQVVPVPTVHPGGVVPGLFGAFRPASACVSRFFVKDRVVLSPSYSHGENKVKRKMRKIHKYFIFIFRLFSDGR